MKITLFFTKIRNVIYLNEAKSNSSFKINVRETHKHTGLAQCHCPQPNQNAEARLETPIK